MQDVKVKAAKTYFNIYIINAFLQYFKYIYFLNYKNKKFN